LRTPCPNRISDILEGRCFFFFFESKVGDEFSRNEFGSMRRIAAIVVEKAFFEIGCVSDILLFRMRFGSEEVGIVHLYSAILLRATHVIWLACQP
jgi:hypothetical protein